MAHATIATDQGPDNWVQPHRYGRHTGERKPGCCTARMSPLTAIMFTVIFVLAGRDLYRVAVARGHYVEAYAGAGLSALICVGLVTQLVV